MARFVLRLPSSLLHSATCSVAFSKKIHPTSNSIGFNKPIHFLSTTSNPPFESQSVRSAFKESPVNPSLLRYIDRIGVGKPRRKRRRKSISAFLSASEEQERFGGGQHRSRSTVPPPPFPSPNREEHNAVKRKRLPVKLLKSVGDSETLFPKPSPNLPEVAVAGRSNVGKSTLLNALMYGSRRNQEDEENEGRGGQRRSRRGKPTGWTARLPRGLKAATSSKPGETRAISFYQLSAKVESGNKVSIVLVNAFASETKAQEWQSLMHSYILGRGNPLKRILLLIDARHGMKRADFDFLESLEQSLLEQPSESKVRMIRANEYARAA
eukprot:CAMPEP_0176030522 /NCGR_PEP_ID=MMETSP0120_2-20121206/15017_1 /TAXON_ID=160619 /ORGANISM="Kryptoperidinium foliaceum, Strain CCMP 1326" /LENGTH=324 /DNA_ID=CAMNT_0017363767 /DNA_START=70 /DNA_END=1048 /DNA_ORIENTATION=+